MLALDATILYFTVTFPDIKFKLYAQYSTCVRSGRQVLNRRYQRLTFLPAGVSLRTVDAIPICWWLPPPWGCSTGWKHTRYTWWNNAEPRSITQKCTYRRQGPPRNLQSMTASLLTDKSEMLKGTQGPSYLTLCGGIRYNSRILYTSFYFYWRLYTVRNAYCAQIWSYTNSKAEFHLWTKVKFDITIEYL